MVDTPPIRKFMFDKSFDGVLGAQRSSTAVPERKPVTLKPEQFDALKKQEWEAGFAAGQATTADEEAQKLAAIIAQMDVRIGKLLDSVLDLQKTQEAQTQKAVLAIARKILPEFIARSGTQEIEPLLASAISDMIREPRLVVRIHESQFDAINARIHEITVQKAYAGKVVVLADAATAPGDCLIEWADGGIERNVEATWNDIEKVVAPDQIQKTTLGE